MVAAALPSPGVAQIWVAQLWISDRVTQKIIHEHGIEPDEVEDTVVCVSGLIFVRSHHPTRGSRALIDVVIRRRPALIVLYPANLYDSDEWNLGSAYFTDRR